MNHTYGIVLCGGGGKGAYQMGVLTALQEYGYLDTPYGISGVSIGALNALAISCCGTEIGKKMWEELTPATVFDTNVEMNEQRNGIFSRKKMRVLLDRVIDFEKINRINYPIYVATSWVESRECDVSYFMINKKSKEDIMKLMEATSALPIIYEDVDYEGVRYMDGGVCDNMPIKPLYDYGCRDFIILALSNDATLNQQQYKDATFHLIKPQKDLGGLLTGTLNFSKQDIQMNLKIGYKDGIRYIKAFLEGDSIIANHYDLYTEMDYSSVLLECKQERIQEHIDSKFDYIKKIEEKYSLE